MTIFLRRGLRSLRGHLPPIATPLIVAVCEPIDARQGLYRFDPDGTGKGLAIAEAHFGNNEPALLAFIIRLMNHYVRQGKGNRTICDFKLLGERAKAIVDKHHPVQRIQPYSEIAGLCSMVGCDELAESLIAEALSLCASDERLELGVLLVKEKICAGRSREKHRAVLERLIALQERLHGTMDLDLRRALIGVYQQERLFQLEPGKHDRERTILQPMLELIEAALKGDETAHRRLVAFCGPDEEYDAILRKHHLFVLKSIGDSYVAENRFDDAMPSWLRASELYGEEFPTVSFGSFQTCTVTGFQTDNYGRNAAFLLLGNGRRGILWYSQLPGDLAEQQRIMNEFQIGNTLSAQVLTVQEGLILFQMTCCCDCREEKPDVKVQTDPYDAEILFDATWHPLCQACIEVSSDSL